MDLHQVRKINQNKLRKKGFLVNENLPYLENTFKIIKPIAVFNELMIQSAIVAVCYGFDTTKAIKWVVDNNLIGEEEFKESLRENLVDRETADNELLVERLWALAWVIGIGDKLEYNAYCSDRFVHLLPDIKNNQSIDEHKEKIDYVGEDKLIAMLDMYYNLHWSFKEHLLKNITIPSIIYLQAIEQRRFALEWVVYGLDWDEISLDT
jgi:hypothetical protein